MFKRLFWLSMGVALGLGSSWWAARFLRRQVERYAPDRLASQAAGVARTLGTELRAALEEGGAAMRRREAELWAELDGRTRRPPVGLKRHDG
ncbi:MAG: hypothetical protein ACRD0Q_03355 [Acidimicrobiales bacterium]